MSSVTVVLRRADESDLPYVERLLSDEGLPSADVRSSPARFYVGYDGDERIGVGGLERYGTDGLLRSVVVERSARADGYGTALCAALERRARADGVETLYLLTTTAAEFFAERGYEYVERTDAPSAIRETTEFDELCPASAACLRKSVLEGA
ncbi:N-acetyltransferase GCN5 [Haloterrigena salina JCM 13891]|uniref:N-acetyltransferase GCN5 n=1 Tax=Haloterrigena salina JCM 13891 TaxID=1227488 RepID=M0CHV1_9EURY|nr:arsenic resistance N-acetyltransferase ArsN2 [Haloterrigena salina]ELZ22816.1 N-acetyltransferase GCN5 [Haloterrigena salina JCM 13891]